MNTRDHLELEEIRNDQRTIHRLVASLDLRIERLAASLEQSRSVQQETPPLQSPKRKAAPPVQPPPLPPRPPKAGKQPEPTPTPAITAQPQPKPAPTPSTPPSSSPAEPPRESFEFEFGRVWLVRVGILMLLTGLVFLGNYAYQNFIANLGPGGKVTLLYLCAGGLAALGTWLERKRDELRNYARVLIAGGAALTYYTTYAATFVERLRIIDSPILGGTLLLALAGGFAWFADRRKSQPLALAAILLSYYTAAINPVGGFTLFSNLLLTALAVLFLVRNRWLNLSYASLIGTYASYAFWRWQSAAQGLPSEPLPWSIGFLTGYWTLFTAAAFLINRDVMDALRRAAFLSANNAAFFGLGALAFAQRAPHSFWLFSLILGTALLFLAWLASRRDTADKLMDGAYLAQGLALLTIGLAAKLTGFQLAFVLAVESTVFLTCSRWRHATLYYIAAALAAFGAFALSLENLSHHHPHSALLASITTAILLFDAWWLKWLRAQLSSLTFRWSSAAFAIGGLLLAGATIWEHVHPASRDAGLALIALLGALSIHILRLPELALPSQAFLLAGAAVWLGRHLPASGDPIRASTALVVLPAAILMHWWPRQSGLSTPGFRRIFEAIAATVLIAIAWTWIGKEYSSGPFMVAASTAALVTFAYGTLTRAWFITALGQSFTVTALALFLVHALSIGVPASPWQALTPIASIAAIGAAVGFLRRHASGDTVLNTVSELGILYRSTAAVLAAFWVFKHISSPYPVLLLSLAAAAFVFAGAWWRHREAIAFGAFWWICAIAAFWINHRLPVLADLAAILVFPAIWRKARTIAADFQLLPGEPRAAVPAIVLASAWLYTTRWCALGNFATYLTVAWSLLALLIFLTGFILRERIYRLGGLTVLALAIARIFLIDVWRFDTLYRIASFIVLGTVLLLLGFFYNRFGETLRKWL